MSKDCTYLMLHEQERSWCSEKRRKSPHFVTEAQVMAIAEAPMASMHIPSLVRMPSLLGFNIYAACGCSLCLKATRERRCLKLGIN